MAVAAVHHIALLFPDQIVEGPEMRLGQIVHVDVVADAGAVRGRVIRAEDHELLELAVGCLERTRDEVGGIFIGLADATLGSAPATLK